MKNKRFTLVELLVVIVSIIVAIDFNFIQQDLNNNQRIVNTPNVIEIHDAASQDQLNKIDGNSSV